MYTRTNIQDFNQIVAEISASYGCNPENVLMLIAITDDMTKGARFASLKGYRSDKSDQTESADHSVILGFSYANMKEADKEVLKSFDLSIVNVDTFNYNKIDTKGKSLEQFKAEVKESLSSALEEMKTPSTKAPKESNDVWINDILVFNRNTKRLSIVGKGMNKKVTEVGEYKKVASAPKTIAKELIRYNLKSNGYRRFAIDNLNMVNLQGETLEIGGM